MVCPPGGDESVELLELLPADGRLHVERLEIVAKMAVGVLVVVAVRQITELPAEPLAAGVVSPRRAPTIAPPIAKRFGDPPQSAAAGEHSAPFSHRQMVRGIEAFRGQVSERAGLLSAIKTPQRVAIVFDKVQVVLLDDLA